jgi:hypothetical protein
MCMFLSEIQASEGFSDRILYIKAYLYMYSVRYMMLKVKEIKPYTSSKTQLHGHCTH